MAKKLLRKKGFGMTPRKNDSPGMKFVDLLVTIFAIVTASMVMLFVLRFLGAI